MAELRPTVESRLKVASILTAEWKPKVGSILKVALIRTVGSRGTAGLRATVEVKVGSILKAVMALKVR